jgi:hypothetical protein
MLMGGTSPNVVQYVLRLEQFVVDQTRSGDKDTDVVAFSAKIGDLLYPTQTKRMENIQAGGHIVNLEIGPILAPPNTPVNFFYSIINSGYDTSDTNVARQVADKLSEIASDILTAFYGNEAGWNKLDELTKEVNKFSFVNCDGPVVMGGQLDEVAIDVLDQWTPTGSYRKTERFLRSTSPATSPPCHGQSDYTVWWSVEANTALLDLVGATSDGHIQGAFRWYDGFWQAFSQSPPPSAFLGALQDVSNAGGHFCVIAPDGGIWYLIGGQFSDVKKLTNDDRGAFSRVSIATLFGELHVCGITPLDGNIWHTIRHLDGSWQAFDNVKSQTSNPGTFVDVSSAGVAGTGELHVCGITKAGGLWHTIRHLDGSWQSFFGDVTSQAGNPGTFQRLGIASVDNELHVCGVTTDGGLWHTIRHMDGSWTPFFDVKNQAGNPSTPAEIPPAFADVSSAGVSGELHLCGTTADGNIWHTIRHTGGSWELFENVTGKLSGQANFLAVSATELLELRRPPQVVISDPFNSSPFQISVHATDLSKSHPIVHRVYGADVFSLRGTLKIQWTGGQGTTIVNPTASSTAIDFDMTGNTNVGDGRDFQVSVQVTDQFGVSVSDQKTVSIDVIGSKGVE